MSDTTVEDRPAENDICQHFAEKCNPKSLVDVQLTHYGPDGLILPKFYSKWSNFVRNMKVREDDTWVVTLPKSGTTWTQEMVWLLQNNLDFDQAHATYLENRFPFLEVHGMHRQLRMGKDCTSMERVDKMPSPRLIKSHLPVTLLPRELFEKGSKAKVIYVARNPKDVCVSYYHFSLTDFGFTGTFEEFVESFIGGACFFLPYWSHVRGFHDLYNTGQPNLLFLTFEEMKENLRAATIKVAKFLGKEATIGQEDILEKLVKHLSFDEMKKNPRVNKEWLMASSSDEEDKKLEKDEAVKEQRKKRTPFMRKGQVGSWKDDMSPECVARFDEWIKANHIPGLF